MQVHWDFSFDEPLRCTQAKRAARVGWQASLLAATQPNVQAERAVRRSPHVGWQGSLLADTQQNLNVQADLFTANQ